MALLQVLGAEGGIIGYGLISHGSKVTINSTSPKTGSYDYSCDLTANANNGQFVSACDAYSGGGDKRWVSFHFRVSALPSAEMVLHTANDDATSGVYNNRITIGTDGKLNVYLGNVLKATSTNAISINTWYWCRVEWYFIASGTTYGDVYINQSQWVYGSVANLAETTFTGNRFGDVCPAGSNFGTTLRIDNIVCNDTTSTVWTTAPPRDIYVLKASPTADGDYEDAGWTGVSDNVDKYKNWDEIPPNGTGTTDVDYNTTNTANINLTSAMPNATTIGIPSDAALIGIGVRGWGRRADALKEAHGIYCRMNNTNLIKATQNTWSNTNYQESTYGANFIGEATGMNNAGTALVASNFDDWELGWFTATIQNPHAATIRISTVWAEIAYCEAAPPVTNKGSTLLTMGVG